MTRSPGLGRACALTALVVVFGLTGPGCATCRFPRLDPTGERIFASTDAPPPGAMPVPGAAALTNPTSAAGTVPAFPGIGPPPGVAHVPQPANGPQLASAPPTLAPIPVGAAGALGQPVPVGPGLAPQPGLSLSPAQIVAPVGSEVVLVARVLGSQGYLLSRERIEWSLNAGEQGQFVAVGAGGVLDPNRLHGLPKKVANTYAINATSTRPAKLDRGTPTPFDDLEVHTGEAWVTVSSPTEGLSHVTAFAPGVTAWDRRQQTSTIYWVDAQWSFPPPAINPIGTRHTFTTALSRQSDSSPLGGYVVRYEIAGGPDAGFSPDGATAAEVTANEQGQASVEIFQKQPAAGTNQINIQVIRPASIGGGGRRLVLGSGTVVKTWTSSQLAVRTTGPAQAGVGSIATYRIEVSNVGGVAARDVVLTDAAPPSLVFVNSNPAANSSPSAQEWRLGEIGPRQTSVIEVNYRIQQAGTFEYCATATSGDGLSARDCATTVAAAGQVTVQISGPDTAPVGAQVQYEIEVQNQSDAAAAGLLITDRFDVGLEHAVSASPIERDLPELAPRTSQKVTVTFRVTRPGQLCQNVEVNGPGVKATASKCLTATGAAGPAESAPNPSPGAPQATPPAVAPPTFQPRAVPPAATSPTLSVRKTGPARRTIGEIAEFNILVTNTGAAALQNVRVADNYETSLEPDAATKGWEPIAGALVWSYPSLEPGQTIELQVNCKCIQEATRSCNRVTVTADGDVSLAAQACLEIVSNQAAGGAPAAAPPQAPPVAPVAPTITPGNLSLTVAEDIDPARAGSEIIYQIALTNKSQESDRQVLVTAQLPPGVTLRGIKVAGTAKATITQRTLRFPPIAELRAGETVTYDVRVRADQPGNIQFTADVTSLRQPTPVTAEATTEILPP